MDPSQSSSRNWCFTLNTPKDEDRDDLLSLVGTKSISYMIIGLEKGEKTEHPHLQGYVHFVKGVTLKFLKDKLCDRAHFEMCKGSSSSNIDYCSKDGDFKEKGDRPRMGSRTDLANIRSLVSSGVAMNKIAFESSSLQGIKYAETLLKYSQMKDREKPRVVWLWGVSGVGKSRKAFSMCPLEDTWVSSDRLEWFDGYFGQSNAIIEDFRGSMCRFAFFLRLLDRYPLRVPVKGGFVIWCPKLIVVTSSFAPKDVYSGERVYEQIDQLLRRIDEVEELVRV